MAEPHQVAEVLNHLRGVYSKADNWPNAPGRRAWEEAFANIPEAEMFRALHATLADARFHQFPPTPMAVVAAVTHGGVAGGPTGPAPCPDCEALPGYREMSIRWEDASGKAHSAVRLAACGCRLGEVRRAAGCISWRALWSKWQGDREILVAKGGRIVGRPRFTSRDHPLLDSTERRTEQDLDQHPVKARSTAAAFLVAALNGRDEHAGERRRGVEREQERDQWEEAT